MCLDADVLYVDEGQVLTSAGASAGLDLCLHIVAVDHGAAVAADAARLAVAPLHRSGGQAQFILRNRRGRQAPQKSLPNGPNSTTCSPGSSARPTGSWRSGTSPRSAAVSVRTLNRRFAAETGQTPMQWLAGVRVRHAQQMLETTGYGVERVGREVGFTSPTNFREQFRRLTGVSPQSYRSTFRERIAG